MSEQVSLEYVLECGEVFRYQLLSRMKSDCEYYLGNGQRQEKHLWANDKGEQIRFMKAIWNSFPPENKPEWLTFEEILKYESRLNEC